MAVGGQELASREARRERRKRSEGSDEETRAGLTPEHPREQSQERAAGSRRQPVRAPSPAAQQQNQEGRCRQQREDLRHNRSAKEKRPQKHPPRLLPAGRDF